VSGAVGYRSQTIRPSAPFDPCVPSVPSVRKEITVKKLLDSWAGIGLIVVILAALGALWASTTV
jgi:hypothetical protein